MSMLKENIWINKNKSTNTAVRQDFIQAESRKKTE